MCGQMMAWLGTSIVWPEIGARRGAGAQGGSKVAEYRSAAAFAV